MPDQSADQTTAAVPLLSGSLHRNLLWLALPSLGEQWLNYCVSLWDTFLAGHVPGHEAGLSTSAVGIAAYTTWLASLLFVLVGTGTTALIARAWGAYDFAEGNRIANWSIPMAAVLGVIVATLMYCIAPVYTAAQGLTGKSYDVVVFFLRMDAVGQLMYVFCIVGSAALRGVGDTRSPMILFGGVNVLNILLSSSFVYGWGPLEPWGLNGIVVGTVISRCIGGLVVLTALARGLSGLKLSWRLMRPSPRDIRRILWIGVPQAVDGILMWLGHSVFLAIIARLSLAHMAAHMIAIQVEALTYLPAVAWGYASATLIGQNLGAGQYRRAMRAGHAAALQCSGVALVGALVYLFGSQVIYGIMTEAQSVRDIGIPAMRALSIYQLPLVVMIVYTFSIRGAGDTRTPMFINMFGTFFVRLPVGYLGALVFDGGLIGAWSGMFADVFVRCALTAWWFRRGGWTRVRV